jgi:anaphase-promoting complex subunit 4
MGNHSLILLCINPGEFILSLELLDLLFNPSNQFPLDNVAFVVRVPVESDLFVFSPQDQVPDNITKYSSESFPTYQLPEDISMRPIRMEVHERSDLRGETPARICLLGTDKSILRVFTFPE